MPCARAGSRSPRTEDRWWPPARRPPCLCACATALRNRALTTRGRRPTWAGPVQPDSRAAVCLFCTTRGAERVRASLSEVGFALVQHCCTDIAPGDGSPLRREYGSSMALRRRERVPCRQVARGYPRVAFICGGPNHRGAGPSGLLLRCEGVAQQQARLPLLLSRFCTEALTEPIDMCNALVQGTAPVSAVWDHRPIQRGARGSYIAATNPRGKEVSRNT